MSQTLLTELQTADKDPGVAFGKRSLPEKFNPGNQSSRKRKREVKEGQSNQSFPKHNPPSNNGGKPFKKRKGRRGKGKKGQDKTNQRKPSPSD